MIKSKVDRVVLNTRFNFGLSKKHKIKMIILLILFFLTIVGCLIAVFFGFVDLPFVEKSIDLEQDLKDAGIEGPVDMVISWGGKPDEERLKERVLWQKKNVESESIMFKRYAFHGEIIIAMKRALKYCQPWLGKIYVVYPQSCSIPETEMIDSFGDDYKAWRENIHFIPDSDIMVAEAIPSFNSHAIESVIDKIPNLSRFFLYSCDDMFVTKRIKLSRFFKDGVPQLPFKKILEPAQVTDQLHNIAWENNRMELLKQNIEAVYPEHQMTPLDKEAFRICRELFPDRFSATERSRFRSKSDVHPIGLVQNVMVSLNLGEWKEFKDTVYMNIFDSGWLSKYCRNWFIFTGQLQKASLVCVNDGSKKTADTNNKTKWLMNNWLPKI